MGLNLSVTADDLSMAEQFPWCSGVQGGEKLLWTLQVYGVFNFTASQKF